MSDDPDSHRIIRTSSSVKRPSNLHMLAVPDPEEDGEKSILSQSGTFKHEDFVINSDGIGSSPFSSAKFLEEVVDDPETPAKPEKGEFMTGLSLKDIEITGSLGRGGSGHVQKGVVKSTGLDLAMKVMHVFEESKRSQVMSELNHLHDADPRFVVKLHDAFYSEGDMFIALEFMKYGSLDDILKKLQDRGTKKIPEDVLAQIFIKCCQILSYLHKDRHQIHRDIKPHNFLINADGEVKISDFGISAQLDNTLDKCETFVGTTLYMSPERLEGDEYSYASDIYSLGLTIMELAQGEYPYPTGGGYWGLLQKIKNGPSPELKQADGFSSELCDIVDQCLQLKAEERPTIQDLLDHPYLAQHENNTEISLKEWLKEKLD
eukprot:GFYU01002408.1.p1 GENE.GFYU01002408.1~~GFYU01002408.1.p1  ORF type:complete len:376 (-),score=40.54 GFYU01002408.1:276-1403(-)